MFKINQYRIGNHNIWYESNHFLNESLHSYFFILLIKPYFIFNFRFFNSLPNCPEIASRWHTFNTLFVAFLETQSLLLAPNYPTVLFIDALIAGEDTGLKARIHKPHLVWLSITAQVVFPSSTFMTKNSRSNPSLPNTCCALCFNFVHVVICLRYCHSNNFFCCFFFFYTPQGCFSLSSSLPNKYEKDEAKIVITSNLTVIFTFVVKAFGCCS